MTRRLFSADNPAYEPDKSADAAAFSRGYLMPTLSPEQNAEVIMLRLPWALLCFLGLE